MNRGPCRPGKGAPCIDHRATDVLLTIEAWGDPEGGWIETGVCGTLPFASRFTVLVMEQANKLPEGSRNLAAPVSMR